MNFVKKVNIPDKQLVLHRTPAGVLICNNRPIYYTCKQGQIRTTKRIFCILLRTNKD